MAQAAQALTLNWDWGDVGDTPDPGGDTDVLAGTDGDTLVLWGTGQGVISDVASHHHGDEMQFAYVPPTSENVEIVAKLVSIEGPPNTQAGLTIRSSLDANATRGAVYFTLDNFTGDMCRYGTTLNQFHLANRSVYDESRPRREGQDVRAATQVNICSESELAADAGAECQSVWLRLRRFGENYSVDRSSDGTSWTPIHSFHSGGSVAPGPAYVGLFVAPGDDQTETNVVTARFENVTVKPLKLDVRTTWIASTYDQESTGRVPLGMNSFYVAPDGTTYKYTDVAESGQTVQIYDGDDGRIIAPWAIGIGGVEQGGISGDGQHVYFGTNAPSGYCVTRRLPNLDLDPQNEGVDQNGNPNGVDIGCLNSVITGEDGVIGGIAVRNSGGVHEVYVSHRPPDEIQPQPGEIRVLDGVSLEPLRTLPFERPGPLAVDRQGNVWVIQAATSFPIPTGFDLLYTPAIRCMKPDGDWCTGGRQIPLESDNDVTLVNPTALAYHRAENAEDDRLFVADNGPDQNIKVYKDLDTTPVFDRSIGQQGGIYSGVPGVVGEETNADSARFFSPMGVGVDTAGNVYVASGGMAFGADIRKYEVGQAPHTWGDRQWTVRGLQELNGSVDFDPETDGRDIYSSLHHFSFDVDATNPEPGSEWGLQAITFDPSYEEKNVFRRIGRRNGFPIIRYLGDGASRRRYMFVLGQAENNPDGDGPKGDMRPINVYRFDGEIAVPYAAVRFDSTCDRGCTPPHCFCAEDCSTHCPEPGPECRCESLCATCDLDDDPTNGTLEKYSVATLWLDGNENGKEDAGETSEPTFNPIVHCAGLQEPGLLRDECFALEDDHHSPTASEISDSPPPQNPTGFHVDENGDIWIAFGVDGRGAAIWRLDSSFDANQKLIYGLQKDAGRFVYPQPEVPNEPDPLPLKLPVEQLHYDSVNDVMYIFNSAFALGNVAVTRFDDWLGERSFDYHIKPPFPTTAGALGGPANDFTWHGIPSPCPLACIFNPQDPDKRECPESSMFFGYQAFDIAGDKIFLSEKWGRIRVYDADDGTFVTTLSAGPEISGFQSWHDMPGLNAFQRENEEYLITTRESSSRAGVTLLRWTPPKPLGEPCEEANHCESGFCVDGICCESECTSDNECVTLNCTNLDEASGVCLGMLANGESCEDGDACSSDETCQEGVCTPGTLCLTCDPSDPFVSLAEVFPGGPNVDGFTLLADQRTAYVSSALGGNYDIYVTTRANTGEPFGELSPVLEINSAAHDRAPSLSSDGKHLYFWTTNTPNGYGDLVVASRANVTEPFDAPVAVPGMNSSVFDQDPFLALGGQFLYFSSERPNGVHRDIYRSAFVNEAFGPPQIVSTVSSGSEEMRPVVTPDGLRLYFGSSSGMGGDTNGDIWLASRANPTQEFGAPTNLSTLNTSGTDLPVAVSPDGCTLYFTSNRDTGLGSSPNLRLYKATRGTPPSSVSVNLNIVGNGSVTAALYNCSQGNVGTCSASRPFGSILGADASRGAYWSGACAPNGAPGLSSDATITYTFNPTCTVTFP